MKKRQSMALKKSPFKNIYAGGGIGGTSGYLVGAKIGGSVGGLPGAAVGAIAGGLIGATIGQGYATAKSYRDKILESEDRMDTLKGDFQDLSTDNIFRNVKNPYANIDPNFENVYEDMVGVDRTATDIATEAFNQQQANALQQMQEMGMINAQQIANAQLKQQQQVTATLAEQTRQADILRAQGAAQVQQMERQTENRSFTFSAVEERKENDNNTLLFTGYASVFDKAYGVRDSKGVYEETIKQGAFKKTLQEQDDVRFLVNHDGIPLARTSSGTLELEEEGIDVATIP